MFSFARERFPLAPEKLSVTRPVKKNNVLDFLLTIKVIQ
jgi:hypothetical protein